MKRRLTIKNLILVVLVAIFLFGFVRQEKAMRRIEKERVAKEAQLESLKNKQERLQEEHDKAQSNEYLEQLARERLNMIKKGETSVEQQKKADSNSQN